MSKKLQGEANFTWREADVSRLENLSDMVFALVIRRPLTKATQA